MCGGGWGLSCSVPSHAAGRRSWPAAAGSASPHRPVEGFTKTPMLQVGAGGGPSARRRRARALAARHTHRALSAPSPVKARFQDDSNPAARASDSARLQRKRARHRPASSSAAKRQLTPGHGSQDRDQEPQGCDGWLAALPRHLSYFLMYSARGARRELARVAAGQG